MQHAYHEQIDLGKLVTRGAHRVKDRRNQRKSNLDTTVIVQEIDMGSVAEVLGSRAARRARPLSTASSSRAARSSVERERARAAHVLMYVVYR